MKPQEKLLKWFFQERRDFPWRKNPTPYRVWVSEVMLQQTRAEVVIAYFEKWMNRFPTIGSLAEASLEEVIKIWEGLGYYSRARNLHKGAQWIKEKHGGIFPEEEKAISAIKGIGPYTKGAILSFAFHRKAVALDGNVLRVASRLFCIKDNIALSSTRKEISRRVEEFIPEKNSWVVMEGLIELGAKVCKKNPICAMCPLIEHCLAYQRGYEKNLPTLSRPSQAIVLHRYVPIIYYDDAYLVQYHQGKKIMADLYEFPYFEDEKTLNNFFPMELIHKGSFTKVVHTFTRYRAHLFPSLWEAVEKKEIPGFQWISQESLRKLPFSSGHRRILQQLMERYAISTY